MAMNQGSARDPGRPHQGAQPGLLGVWKDGGDQVREHRTMDKYVGNGATEAANWPGLFAA
jgi:hypothetical protein